MYTTDNSKAIIIFDGNNRQSLLSVDRITSYILYHKDESKIVLF